MAYKIHVFVSTYAVAAAVAYDVCDSFLFVDPLIFFFYTVVPKTVSHFFIIFTLVVTFFIICLGVLYLCELEEVSRPEAEEQSAHYPHPAITLNVAGAVCVIFYIATISTQW